MQEELTIDILRQWNEKTADLLYNAYYRALVVFSKQIVKDVETAEDIVQDVFSAMWEKKIPFERIDTEESIRRWNAGEIPVALIQPMSLGMGVNLQQGGSTIVWYTLPWSLELYTQTVDRLFRQGQQAETVSVIHITAKDTIDGRIVKALKDKDSTQAALIEAVKAVLQ